MEPALTRSLVICVSSILKAQEISNEVWESGLVRKAFSMLLSISQQDNGSIRRTLQDELRGLLESHYDQGFTVTSHYLLRQLEGLCRSFDGEDFHELLNYLLVFSHLVPSLHADSIPTLFSSLLQVRSPTLPFILVPPTLRTASRRRSASSLRRPPFQRPLRLRRPPLLSLLAAAEPADAGQRLQQGRRGVCPRDVSLCSLVPLPAQRGAADCGDAWRDRVFRLGRFCRAQSDLALSYRFLHLAEGRRGRDQRGRSVAGSVIG